MSDPLDMNNYRLEKLPKMQKSGFEIWMARLGGPLAILAFVLIYWFGHFGFIDSLTAESVSGKALARLNEIGLPAFIRSNYAMLAIFTAGLILWMTEAIPNYLTSLIIILLIVLCGVTTQKEAFAQLGHPVMWLNILSFVLASMLVKTKFAKRLAMWFVIKFGKTAKGVLWSFLIINIVLSMFISATTVKATIMLPIFMVVCAIYGASDGHRNNFGRNLVIQNLFQVNIGANAFYTGSGAHLLAISLIFGAAGASQFGYSDWLVSCGPMSFLILIIGLLMGMYVFFPMKKDEQKPQIDGGLERLKTELDAMGRMTVEEWKAVGIFMGVLILWCTDSLHGIDATTVAFIGAVIALMPGIGVVKWNDVDIPWHLMLFSAGAYTLGAGLNITGLPGTMVKRGLRLNGHHRQHSVLGAVRHPDVPDDVLRSGLPVQDHQDDDLRADRDGHSRTVRLSGHQPCASCLDADRARLCAAVQQQASRPTVQHQPVQYDGRLQVRHHDDDHLLADNPPLGRDRPQMARHHPGFVLCGIICYIRKCMPRLF